MKPWREAAFTIGETRLRLAVASGWPSARQLMDALRTGQADYDFVEVMAGGGPAHPRGQPYGSPHVPSSSWSPDQTSAAVRFW